MQIFLLVDWYYLKQQRQQVHLVPDQVEIRFLNTFSDVVCLKLLGSEVHTLGLVYLNDCFRIGDGVKWRHYKRVVLSKVIFRFSLSEKRAGEPLHGQLS